MTKLSSYVKSAAVAAGLAAMARGAHSDAKRPLSPTPNGHEFRFQPVSNSIAKRPIWLGL